MTMRKILISLAIGLFTMSASAQSLRVANANYPGIYCRFSSNCEVSPAEQSDSYAPTNVAVTCVLASRSFPGTSADSNGHYGYEYQLTLNNNGSTDTNVLTVESLTLNFGEPDPFAFGGHASNRVWVVVSGGPVGVAPASADLAGSKVIIHFDPPLILSTDTDQSTNTCYFGMMSPGAPKMTWAILAGSTKDPLNGMVPFKLRVKAQTPAN
jgi:hypothetical protein